MGTVNVDDDPPVATELFGSVTVCSEGTQHCTIYASESTPYHRASTWMRASGDAFVALAEIC